MRRESAVLTPDEVARFFDKTIPEPNSGCLLWTASTNLQGYGGMIVIRDRKKRRLAAHRIAYQLAYGDLPAAANVCHRCDTPLCVNPDHLFLGTQADNLADMRAKGRGSPPPPSPYLGKTHCKRGHEFTPENTHTFVQKNGWGSIGRRCRTCDRARRRKAA